MPGALEGLRIVDLTTGLAGPLATMVLSDHGADVVKVEPPGGDPQRSYVGSVVTNRGKRSVVLDLDVAGRIAIVSSSSSTPPTCWSRASRPGTSPTGASTTRPSRRGPARRSCTAR